MLLIDLIRFLILLSVLIFVHESGHFLFAKLFGVAVEEFGFGIPPRLIGKKIRGTVYSLNLLPIGGFVRLKGEEGETLGFGHAGSFAIQSKIKRTLILIAGVLGNFLLAWVVFSILLAVGTLAPAGKVEVDAVFPGSPAAGAGIASGDLILSFSGEKVETAAELVELTNSRLGEQVSLEVETAGAVRPVTVVPREDPPEGEGPLGVRITDAVAERRVAWWQAPFAGFADTVWTLGAMVDGLGRTVAGLIRGEEILVGGPVAIYALSQEVANGGLKPFASFTAILSLNLVVVNLLPIPALDGGRVLFIALEAIRGRKLSPRTEHLANSVGFAFLILLIVLLSIRDVQTFF